MTAAGDHTSRLTTMEPHVLDVDGRRALVVGGAVQSVAVDRLPAEGSYWHAMLPDQRPRNVLLLGLGAGTIAHLLVRRFGSLPIVGVEASEAIVRLARTEFGLADLPELRIVVADAFAFVDTCADQFDQLYVDLFVGNELARGVIARPFLRRLRQIVTAEGTITFNFFLDRRSDERLHRLRSVFREVRPVTVGKNQIVRCRG